jgi:hypothetical protein
MEQLKVGTNDLLSVAKKNVVAVAASVAKKNAAAAVMSVSSTEAFPTTGLALQLEVPMAAAASIHSQKMGDEC